MSESTNLNNQFLIAMPSLNDPLFVHSVTYICEHSADGAMGIVINRPMDINTYELLDYLQIKTNQEQLKNQIVYAGGPLQNDRGFVLHSPGRDWQSSLNCSENLTITSSKDILEAIAQGEGPADSFIALGYAGWEPGQLEAEIAENIWLTAPANSDIIFQLSYPKRWQAAANLIGVNIETLSGDIGHA